MPGTPFSTNLRPERCFSKLNGEVTASTKERDVWVKQYPLWEVNSFRSDLWPIPGNRAVDRKLEQTGPNEVILRITPILCES